MADVERVGTLDRSSRRCWSRSGSTRPRISSANALITDMPTTRRRPGTRSAGGRAGARPCDWFEAPGQALDDSDPPFYTWFARRQAERLAQLPGPPRRGRPRRPRRVPLARRGGRGARRSRTRELLADVQRFANALKARGIGAGRRRRDLPADDPRGRRRDARLRADRRAAQRRLRRLQRRVGAASAWSSPRPRR